MGVPLMGGDSNLDMGSSSGDTKYTHKKTSKLLHLHKQPNPETLNHQKKTPHPTETARTYPLSGDARHAPDYFAKGTVGGKFSSYPSFSFHPT